MTPERWREVTQIYGAVISRAPERRKAALAELCGTDEELRREIESLLESQHGAELLDRPLGERPSLMQILTVGSQIGVFRIDGLLGVGGMGEVYRARDTKLNRYVAIKILPPAFASDPDRLARFKREAQVLASLNHPNIGAIHGFEDSGGVHALVLELVEGPTLADRVARGRLETDEALAIARQIADALEVAHEQGIVHRDLKPANIKIREDGTVKVLDFGLAKLVEPPEGVRALKPAGAGGPEGPHYSQSPTITTPAMTAAGMILGTAAYMSPEQAKGKPADKRSDIWAFGCVLYEMLTSRRAFAADDVPETLAAVLTRRPDFVGFPLDVPTGVKQVIVRCLERDRRRRFADISDVRFELEESVTGAANVDRRAAPEPLDTERRWRWVACASAVLAMVAAGWAGWMWFRGTPSTAPTALYRSEIPLPTQLSGQAGARLSLSPDGQRLAFVAPDSAHRVMLWVRPLDAESAQPLAGTEGAAAPFWSPDSRFIAFTASGKLKKVDAAGGQVITLCDATAVFPGAWSASDVILFTPQTIGPLYRVAAAGGAPVRVTNVTGTVRHAFPVFLPDSRRFLYVSETSNGSSRHIELASLDGDDVQTVTDQAISPSLAAGRLLFVRNRTLFAQPFDSQKGQLSGEAQPIVNDVETETTGRFGAAYGISRGGVLAFQPSTAAPTQLSWFDRSGRLLGTLGTTDYFNRVLRLSPDGTTLAADGRLASDTRGGIWLYDVATGAPRRFTQGQETYSVWSPDSRQVLFASRRKGRMDLFINGASAAPGTEQLLFADDHDKFPTSWSSDSHFVLFNAASADTGTDVWVLPMQGQHTPRVLIHSGANERSAVFSPDGRWVAYVSDDAGRADVRVTSFPSAEHTYLMSPTGGDSPRWRRDQKELFYVALDGTIHVVAIDSESGGFRVVDNRPLFRSEAFGDVQSYDVSADGQRIIVPVSTAKVAEVVNLIVNWPLLLR